jgi:Beta-L-arabinofuranosidase, GH127 middle domain
MLVTMATSRFPKSTSTVCAMVRASGRRSMYSTNWKERGLRLDQQTRFPDEPTTKITLQLEQPARFALRVRVPELGRQRRQRQGRRPQPGSIRVAPSYLVLEESGVDKTPAFRNWNRTAEILGGFEP